MVDELHNPPVVAVLTVASLEHEGERKGRGFTTAMDYVREHFAGPITIVDEGVPNASEKITERIMYLAKSCCLVLTIGGTGLAAKDVTPEATVAACSKMLPGFGEAMRARAAAKGPVGLLYRYAAGICGGSLIINLPDDHDTIGECMDPVLAAIPHALQLAGCTDELKVKPA